uniref:HTH La-type RNA-binding domain-containing protein n=1 Tax=Oryza nivara TaxID=4536 RepID=A0A0E0IN19_ORYNI
MSPAAGGAAPTQLPPPPVAASPSPPPLAAAAAIAGPEGDRAPPPQGNRRDPAGSAEGADPGNAAARKTAWNVPAPPLAAAAAAGAGVGVPGGGIMGGGPGSWPALAESAAARGSWPKSASSDSLKSLSDGSAPSASEDLIVPSVQPHPVANPISGGSNPTSSSPPPNATVVVTSEQNGNTDQSNPVRHSSGGHCAGSNSSRDGNTSDGGDGSWNDGGLGSGSGSNSSYGHGNSTNGAGGANMNNIIHSSGTSSSANDSSRRISGNNNWNNNGRSAGSNHNAAGSGDGSNRNLWNNNGRNGGGSSNGFVGRGGHRNRRDHERGGSFSPRNYPRHTPMPPQQQQPGIYQAGPFPRPPPPPPPGHFMVPQPFVPYVPHFAYPADVQGYPFYLPPMEQFQNMHLVRPQMQPLWVPQDQQNLQEDIRTQIEFYFSTNNLCHDTFLRRQMDDQGWVHIDVITKFNRMRRFTNLVDTNYILDAVRGSELVEVQGNTVRRRNNWAEWSDLLAGVGNKQLAWPTRSERKDSNTCLQCEATTLRSSCDWLWLWALCHVPDLTNPIKQGPVSSSPKVFWFLPLRI